MKRTLLLSACAALSLAAVAQDDFKVANLEALQRDVDRSNADIANPKKADSPKTWVARGEAMMRVHDRSTMNAAVGTPQAFYAPQKPKQTTTEIGETSYTTFVFPNIDLYFNAGGLLACWRETQAVVDAPLSLALEAYRKAVALDAKGSSSKAIKEGLEKLARKHRAEGVNAYTRHDYPAAQRHFMESVQASMHPLVGGLDSIMAYYAGLMSLMESVQDYDNAITYLTICVDNGYYEDGDVYLRLGKAYELKGDKKRQEQALVDGFTRFPQTQSILIELINMYLTSGDDATAVLPYLHRAQENEPGNGTLFFAEATLYERLAGADSLKRGAYMGDAERLYLKAIEVSPDSYNAYYNLGALYYNRAVEYVKQASAIKDWRDPQIKALEDLANVEFKRALEPFERAHGLQPGDKYALETVKNICFRFRNESAEFMDKYNLYNEKFKHMTEAAPAPEQ